MRVCVRMCYLCVYFDASIMLFSACTVCSLVFSRLYTYMAYILSSHEETANPGNILFHFADLQLKTIGKAVVIIGMGSSFISTVREALILWVRLLTQDPAIVLTSPPSAEVILPGLNKRLLTFLGSISPRNEVYLRTRTGKLYRFWDNREHCDVEMCVMML